MYFIVFVSFGLARTQIYISVISVYRKQAPADGLVCGEVLLTHVWYRCANNTNKDSYFTTVRKLICFYDLNPKVPVCKHCYTSSHMNILKRFRLFKFVSFRVFRIRIYTFRIASRDTTNIYLNSVHRQHVYFDANRTVVRHLNPYIRI